MEYPLSSRPYSDALSVKVKSPLFINNSFCLLSPLISTSLYFVVFGSAIGSRITEIEGVSYGSFIVQGMIMLTVLTQLLQMLTMLTP